jgi:truncated hemoglobin YjbI
LGVHHGIRISNMSRDLYLKCWTSRKASELAEYLMETSRTYAQDFTNSNRYDSFAPIRSHTSAQWFIDGANHFEAVSEALESAKQEIFITDWWLSPEIYMRRPVRTILKPKFKLKLVFFTQFCPYLLRSFTAITGVWIEYCSEKPRKALGFIFCSLKKLK